MESDDDEFNPAPEYFASIIAMILRRIKQDHIKLELHEFQEIRNFGIKIENAKDGKSMQLSLVRNEGGDGPPEFVGLDYATDHLPNPDKLN